MRAYAIVDLQFGSTGKGLLAGYLARRLHPDGVVCAFGPNAGHTFIDGTGRKFVHVMMPMGALSPEIKTVFIGPGAVVHPDILLEEHLALKALGYQYQLVIHEAAAVVQQRHRDAEVVLGQIGSTQKGTGACAAEKIRRLPLYVDRSGYAHTTTIARDVLRDTPLEGYVVPVAEYNDLIDNIKVLQIEGAQGFSLGINSGFYPYCTYRDCSIWQLLADCAIPRQFVNSEIGCAMEVYGTARTYPIRVNNKTGSSGPGYHDQEEISWEDVQKEPELTTVTKLPRRIFTFSEEQIKQAVRANVVDYMFLNFANYCQDGNELDRIVKLVEKHAPVGWIGTGPCETDVQEYGGIKR